MSIDTLNVDINLDSVTINNVRLCGYCNSKFLISVTKSSDTLKIVQIDTVIDVTTCSCLFDIGITISGLSPGTYTAVVYRNRILPNGEYLYVQHKFIGSIQFDILHHSSENSLDEYIFYSHQSDCISINFVEGNSFLYSDDFFLIQNYPNPFNPVTIINYKVPLQNNVIIKIFDLQGRQILTLIDEKMQAGNYKIVFNGTSLPSGIYFCHLQTGKYIETIKLLLIK